MFGKLCPINYERLLAVKRRVLERSMHVAPDHGKLIATAACILHNLVRRRDGKAFDPPFQDGFPATEIRLPSEGEHRPTKQALEGSVSWQDEAAYYIIGNGPNRDWTNNSSRLLEQNENEFK